MSELDIGKRSILLIGALYNDEEISDLNIIFSLDSCSDEDNAVIHISEFNLPPNIYMIILDLLKEYFGVDPSISLMAIDSEDSKIIVQR